ncbi:MAG: hypothetical protein BroJett031_35670 [Betaproteobacteria bacterium]|jgi:hypothetical protein|nr:MAG: hypothetical protein BroJett031_35670 [Betaproteobacteria bacterium]
MHPVWLSLAAFALATLSGCATTTVIAPEPKQKAEIKYERGIATLWSFARSSAAIAGAPSRPLDSDARPYFLLTVANYGATPINIDIDRITVTANGVRLPVYSYEALMAESKSREKWRTFGAAIAAGLGAAAAEQEGYGHSTTSVNTRGTFDAYGESTTSYATPTGRSLGQSRTDSTIAGRYSSDTTVSTTTYDPAAAEAARGRLAAENERQLAEIRAAAAREQGSLDSSYFRAQTLARGKPYTGWISVDRPARPSPVNRYVVTVRIGDEEHAFAFEERELR